MPLASSKGCKTSSAAQDFGTGDLTKDCFMFLFLLPQSIACCAIASWVFWRNFEDFKYISCLFQPIFKTFFVLFYLLTQIPDVGEEEAVRIFIEFERMESAIKGKVHQCEMVTYCG